MAQLKGIVWSPKKACEYEQNQLLFSFFELTLFLASPQDHYKS